MKKLTLIICIVSSIQCFSQSDIAGGIGHQRIAGRFCGWSPLPPGSVAGSFELRNDFINQPINFFTTNTGTPIQRMTILGTTGFVGMGNGFGAPVNLLHLNGFGNNTGLLFRSDGNQNLFNRWQMFTGPNGGSLTEKGAFFTTPNANTQPGTMLGLSNAAVNQFHINANLGDIILAAHGVNPIPPFQFSERMRISGYDAPVPNYGLPTVPRTRISISNATPIVYPLAMLHIGDPWSLFNGGPHRDWMDVGTYYHVDSDALYVGIKHLNTDINEGIICFGNNPSATPFKGDRMRFLFAGAGGNGTSSGNAGLEFMHFYTVDGTNPRVSVGDFQTQGVNADPRNTLEILSSPTSPYFSSGNGSSGLKFRNLTSNNFPVTNPGVGVLALDTGGNVIYVQGSGVGAGFGQCPNPTALAANSGIALSTFDFLFTGQGTQVPNNTTWDQVGVGYSCTQNMPAKFNTLYIDPTLLPGPTNQKYYAGHFTNQSLIAALQGPVTSWPLVAGLYADASGIEPKDVIHVGGDFTASNCRNSFGVRAQLSYINPNTNVTSLNHVNVAGLFYNDIKIHPAIGAVSDFNFGIYSFARNASTFNVAVYGETPGVGSANVGFTGNYAGYFKGDVGIVGTTHHAGASVWSDSTIKTNISNIENPLSIINRLQPKSFYFDTTNNSYLNLPSQKQYGFIAQPTLRTTPELTRSFVTLPFFDSTGNQVSSSRSLLAVNYNAVIGLLTAGMQEQQLSIDSLRNNSAGNNLGNICGGTQNTLPTDWEIPLNGKNFLFTSNNSTGNVGIGGYNCAIGDKLTVMGSSVENNTGIHVTNTTNTSSSSAYLTLTNDISGNNASFAFHSSSYTTPSLFELTTPGNINLSPANSSDINLETSGGLVNVNSVNPANVPVNSSLAVHGGSVIENNAGFPSWMQIMNGSNPMAYLGGNNSYGELNLYNGGASSSPLVSISAFPGQYTYFNSGAYTGVNTNAPGVTLDVNGTVRAVSYATSDSTLKTNITALNGQALNKVKNFRAVSYEWITPEDTAMYGTQYGFTAQQIETIEPGLVKTDKDGKKILSYNGVIAFLTKALQEQQSQIDSMKSVMQSCCSSNARTTSTSVKNNIDVELADADVIVLNQNQPNPFAEQTTITFNIPQNTGFAQMLFYDVNGRQIKTVDITKKGKGQLTVFANDLSNGIYSYTLIVDGKIFETKKMIKQQ